jgi:hypothetical protein
LHRFRPAGVDRINAPNHLIGSLLRIKSYIDGTADGISSWMLTGLRLVCGGKFGAPTFVSRINTGFFFNKQLPSLFSVAQLYRLGFFIFSDAAVSPVICYNSLQGSKTNLYSAKSNMLISGMAKGYRNMHHGCSRSYPSGNDSLSLSLSLSSLLILSLYWAGK